ncbi:MAG TPA: tRNA (adenosine(37)-N6)-dimethylallyltransferase MiaA [Candidatus Eisenbacteria bacterium]|nr:tRNA (adenosine(37)-N6)-dimethylallyltransferase MiaA [Candidatus Eisenbacteria bacterium]
MASPPLLVIAGATATGKTGLSLDVAESLRAQGIPAGIISADSRQVYRGLDIGTAKVSAADRARVPHHGLDLVDPDEPFSVADFVRHARGALAAIAADEGLAILVGGTGLYLRAVARGLDVEALPSDPALRARIDAALIEDGLEAAAERLRRLAPALAASTDLRNPRRVSRALEIAELAGDVERPELGGYSGRAAWIGLTVPDETHRTWIAERARAQFDAGLIEEAAALRKRWDPALPAFSAIGYREAWAVLDGAMDREAAIAEDARRNVAFARRQRTWFRSEPEIHWLDAGSTDLRALAMDTGRRLVHESRSPANVPR